MKIRIFRVLFFFVASSIVFFSFSCSKPEQQPILVVGITGDTDSFNPLITQSRFGTELSKMMYLSLLEEQPDLVSFKPSLARNWETFNEGKTIRFHLRSNALWSDSVRITADDVYFTWTMQLDSTISWTGASVKDQIKNVSVVDDSTIDFIFEAPYTYQLMDINEGVILPKHIFENLDKNQFADFDFTIKPVTSGPYILKSWTPNQYIELLKNDLFYNPSLPKIDHIVFKIVPDNTQLLTQLKTNEIQVMEGVQPLDAEQFARENGSVKIEHFPYAQYVQISWNMNRPMFQDVNVRKGLTEAIDRQALVDHLLKGFGRVCTSPVHPILWAFDSTLTSLPFNPDEAKALFAQAGWTDTDGDGYLDKDKKVFEFSLLTNIGSQVRDDAMVMIQDMLKNAGVKLVPQRLEWSVYVEKLMARDYDAILIGMMSATKVDVFPVWHSSMCGEEGFNLSCYKNSFTDSLIEKARLIPEREKALPLWYEFQNAIINDQPATFLWVPERLVGFNTSVNGYKFSPVSTFFNIAEWYIH